MLRITLYKTMETYRVTCKKNPEQSSLKIKKRVNYWANQGSEFHQEIFACLKKVV